MFLQFKCQKPCEKKNKNCSRDHQCKKLCFQDCGLCTLLVKFQLSCGHEATHPCSVDLNKLKCYRKCRKICPNCGCKCRKYCWECCYPCTNKVSKIYNYLSNITKISYIFLAFIFRTGGKTNIRVRTFCSCAMLYATNAKTLQGNVQIERSMWP